MATVIELPIQSYEGQVDPDWCPGCGDFGVLKALKVAAGKLGIKPKDLIVVSGIGCSSNLPGFIHTYGVHKSFGSCCLGSCWTYSQGLIIGVLC